MSNTTTVAGQGLCPAPFLQADLFSTTGGFVEGRFCSAILGPTCCLPCPQTEWLYPDNFKTITDSASWVNVASMACSVFLVVSFAVLPIEKTHRHYLSVCLAIGVTLMQLGFIIPLGAKPNPCYNSITPNDQDTNKTCAFSGAFLIAGGWCGVMWVFLRALALHLQICWQVVIGKNFMWGALAAGWGIPAIGLTVAMVFSGVSFRFGDTCHINHKNSLADLWIPLLIFAGVTVIIQFGTFGYCIKVYLASLTDDSTTTNSSGVRSYNNSLRGTISPRQAYRRIRRVIELQWRGIVIVLLIIADVIFFAVVFVFMDDLETNILKNPTKSEDWLACLVKTGGDKNACLSFANSLVVNEATVMSVLILLSLNGVWCLLLLGRFSMFTGWYEMVMGKFRPNNEFVSADVRAFKDPRDYEMLSRDRETGKTPEPLVSQPITPLSPSVAKSGRETPDYFSREARYQPPARSFSNPKPPQGHGWDPTATQARPYMYPGMDPLSMNKI
ncbi:G protein-like protein-coupled receptor : GPCR, secretin-like protein [Mollisia scopiformis]|uniref:G protein-like protein-coupled receptor: GPCR, secretin-like protein n=1 Tax=Mollisia scopiformis TaxID=149040 RepID=A0A194XV18_MOLSC|nr:G protein-like protein-coupled receptor : GPCR, secretin-like protein [Mollisia scopiformis]KUJ24053.1 G protein-like protein-coupled receptor : GPCR, secretin-like protein [Mollisia scopiformis]